MAYSKRWRQKLRWFGVPVTIVALLWTMWLIRDTIPSLKTSWATLHKQWLIVVLGGMIVSGYIIFEVFFLLYKKISIVPCCKKEVRSLYFAGQLMKHLPGRVWGLAYQVSLGPQLKVEAWLSLHVFFSLLSTGFALLIAVFVVAQRIDSFLSAFVVSAGVACYFVTWNNKFFGLALAKGVRKVKFLPLQNAANHLASLIDADYTFKWKILLLLTFSWVSYLFAWAVYGAVWPSISLTDGVWLGAVYTLAWFVGYVSLITPSGLGVRELVFLTLTQNYPAESIVGMAVLARIMLLITDFLLGLFALRVGASHE